MGRPSDDNDETPARFVDDPESEAGALMRRLPEPAPWSATRKQRMRAALDERLGRSSWRSARVIGWSAVAAAIFVAGLFAGLEMGRPRTVASSTRAAAPPTAASADAAPLVVASGQTELRGDRVIVTDGRVVVAARATPVLIEIPAEHTRVRVAANAIVAVRVRGWRVQVSAYRGNADVVTDAHATQLVAPGRTLDSDGDRTIEPEDTAEIERALDGRAAAPTPTITTPTTPAAAPIAVLVPAHGDRAPRRRAPSESAPSEPPPPIAVAVPVAAPPSKLPLDDDSRTAPAAAPPPSAPPPPSIPAAPPAAVAPSALAREAADLRAAVQRLRHDHDPAGALVLLDGYLRQHPRGLLRTDAELARVDALLQTGERSRALAALDQLPLDGLPRARELRLTRGELRAEAGRCRDALADLAPIANGADDFSERALYRQASCRARLGDAAAARAGLDDYVRRFPSGRFAVEARRALGMQ
jgi:hypothetical protein